MPSPSEQLVLDRCWWPSHLCETACACGEDVYDYVCRGFGITHDQLNSFYLEQLQLEYPFGRWPEFVIPHQGHSILINYYGEPRHEVTYSHAETGQATAWASACGNHMLPGFQWIEALLLSRRTSCPSTTLLLLLPSCDIPRNIAAEAQGIVSKAFESLGYAGALIDRFSRDLVLANLSDDTWHYDQQFGWVTSNWHSWRCRGRSDQGLWRPADAAFTSLKRFTDALGVLP